MKRMDINALIVNRPCISAIALILGLSFWLMFCQSYRSTAWFTVPVLFYPQADGITAPETIDVCIGAQRSALWDMQNLAVHINAQTVEPGNNTIAISTEELLLPPQFDVIATKPAKLVICKAPALKKEELS